MAGNQDILTTTAALIDAGHFAAAKATFATGQQGLLEEVAASPHFRERLAVECVLLQADILLRGLLKSSFPEGLFEVHFAPEPHSDVSIIKCVIERAGTIHFTFPTQLNIARDDPCWSGLPTSG